MIAEGKKSEGFQKSDYTNYQYITLLLQDFEFFPALSRLLIYYNYESHCDIY